MTALVPGQVLAGRFELVAPCASSGRRRWIGIERATGQQVELLWRGSQQPAAADLHAAAASLRVEHPALASSRGLFRHEGCWVAVQQAPLQTTLGVGLGRVASQRQVVALATALAGGLAALHREGLVHGDIHPAAVSIAGEQVRLCGFRGPQPRPVLRAGQTAPEVVSGGPCSAASDLYGLGVVLYTYALGELPYGQDGWRAAARQRTAERAALPQSEALSALVAALLSPQPGARPTAEELLVMLGRLQRSVPVSGRLLRWPEIRPRATHAVVGQDPETSQLVVVCSGCSRSQARRRVRELRAAGWQARSERIALGGRDLLGTVCMVVGGHVVLPLLGAVVASVWWLWVRSSGLRAREVAALPPLQRVVPRVRSSQRRPALVSAGVALLTAGLVLGVLPWLSAVLVLVAALIAQGEVERPARHPATVLRVELALEDLERIAEQLCDPEASLSLLGEVEALRRQWGRPGGDPALVLQHAESLGRRHRAAWEDSAPCERYCEAWIAPRS